MLSSIVFTLCVALCIGYSSAGKVLLIQFEFNDKRADKLKPIK